MKYGWVTLSILAIWVCAALLMTSPKLSGPETFFLFVMATTVTLSYIGFKSA